MSEEVKRVGGLDEARAIAVVGLGFGDEGKGATVDALCVMLPGVAAVVRWSGGAQAAHNVIAQGRHHTFAQFGSGTFAGVPTFLAEHMMVNPLLLASEAEELAALGVAEPLSLLTVDARCLVTTPVHVAANRTREDARGAARHGSCGIGVGETTWYALAAAQHARRGQQVGNMPAPADASAPALRVGDCLDPEVLRERLEALVAFYRPLLATGSHTHPSISAMAEFLEAFAHAITVVDGDEHLGHLLAQGTVIFEGSQGVLLDEWRGFHPHTTWSTTEPSRVREMCRAHGVKPYVLGATRAYQTRHGAGPFPSEVADSPERPEPHNGTGVYQGDWRTGDLDLVLLRYAVQVCGGVDGIAVGHLDTLHEGQSFVRAYRVDGDEQVDTLPLGAWKDLNHQEGLTALLTRARPVRTEAPTQPQAVLALLKQIIGAPVVMESFGPARDNRRLV